MKEIILVEIKALSNILKIKNPISIEIKSARGMYNRLRDLYGKHSSEFTEEMISECKRLATELERKSKKLKRNRRPTKKRHRENQDTNAEKQAIKELLNAEVVAVRIVQGGSPGLNKRKR